MSRRVCARPGCGRKLPPSRGPRERLWCSEWCRKTAKYGGTCEGCGAATNGSNGKAKAPKHCTDCAPAAHKTWTRERIIEAIRKWAREYREPPTAADWSPAMAENNGLIDADEIRERYEAGEWPSTCLVQREFGTWNEGVRAAGFAAIPSGKRRYLREAA